jgi:phage portal protein BeeE
MVEVLQKAGMVTAQAQQPAMMEQSSAVAIAEPTEEKPRAMFHDPYSVMDWGGWRQRPSMLTYETLRQMSTANTVIAAILNLRVEQVGEFCRPQQGRHDKGFRVILRDRRDKRKGMSTSQQKEAEAIERFLETTAILMPEERPSDRDSFRAFNKKAVRDVLTYDQWAWERQRDRVGRPSRFVALPSETIRPAVADTEHMSPEEMRSRVAYVQVYENTVIAEFTVDELAWCIMKPRSDIRVNGFGFSPIEQIIRLVTAWLFGFEYNTRFFTQGSAIKGLLNIKGAIPDRQLRAFRRMWYSQIAGVTNAWKTPILNAEDINWTSMHSTNREMEYGQWMDWLTKLICAIYGVDPIEINFIFGNSGQTSSLGNSRPNAEEVTESKDKGLRPLLTHIEDSINRYMIWELNPDFEFSFTGYDSKAEDKEREALVTEGKSFRTINEIRAAVDEEPLPGKLGDIIMDPTYLQWATAQEQAAQQAGSMGPGGEHNTVGHLFGMPGGGNENGEGFGGDENQPPGQGAGPGQPPKPGGGPKPFGGANKPPGGGKPQQLGQGAEDSDDAQLASQSGGESANQDESEDTDFGGDDDSEEPEPMRRSQSAMDERLRWIDEWLPRGG